MQGERERCTFYYSWGAGFRGVDICLTRLFYEGPGVGVISLMACSSKAYVRTPEHELSIIAVGKHRNFRDQMASIKTANIKQSQFQDNQIFQFENKLLNGVNYILPNLNPPISHDAPRLQLKSLELLTAPNTPSLRVLGLLPLNTGTILTSSSIS